MSTPDGQIISPTPQDQQAEAWMNLAVKIGGDVGSLAASDRARHRRELLPMAPLYASAVVPASGTVTLDLGTPARGKVWEVRGLSCVDASNPGGVPTGGVPVAVSVTQAAGAATSAVLPAGASLTGFEVDFQAPAAAVSGAITITGLSTAAGGSGTLSYDVTVPPTGLILGRMFPGPLAPASPAATPQVNVPAIGSGPAYSVNVYGTTAPAGATPGAGFWFTGIPSVYGPQNARWTIPALPTIDTKGGQHITVPAGERLFAVLTGCAPGHTIVARADILEDIPGHATAIHAL